MEVSDCRISEWDVMYRDSEDADCRYRSRITGMKNAEQPTNYWTFSRIRPSS